MTEPAFNFELVGAAHDAIRLFCTPIPVATGHKRVYVPGLVPSISTS